MKNTITILVGILIFALPLCSYGDTSKKSKSKETIDKLERQQETTRKKLQEAERGTLPQDDLQHLEAGTKTSKSRKGASKQQEDDPLKRKK